MRFRLLAGRHVQADRTQKPRTLSDNEGGTTKVYPSKTYLMGDEVEADQDLVALFGREKFERLDPETRDRSREDVVVSQDKTFSFPHGQVFQGHQVSGSAPSPDHAHGLLKGESRAVGDIEDEPDSSSGEEGPPTKGSKASSLKERYPEGLDHMTKAQLQHLAHEEEIDLGEARTKEEVLQVLRLHAR